MFQCRRCGLKDDPCWRASRYFLYVVHCKIDELDVWDKPVADKLRQLGKVDEPPYHYRLTKTGRVYRMLIELKDYYYHGGTTEKHYGPFKKEVKERRLDEFQVEE